MAYTELTCRSGGSNLYAGTLDGSAEASTTPLATYASGNWDGTSVFTVASGNPVTDGVQVGHFASVYANGATVTGYVGRVTAVSSTTITVSTTAKSGTAPTSGTGTRTLVVGGAWKGPNGASGFPFGFATGAMTDAAGNLVRVNFKNDQTYGITAAMTHNVAGPIFFQGYTASFGDLGRAVVDGGTTGASYYLLTLSSTTAVVMLDFQFQNNGNSGSTQGVFVNAVRCVLGRCVFTGMYSAGVYVAGGVLFECEAYGNNLGALNTGGFEGNGNAAFVRCFAHHNVGTNGYGFGVQNGSTATFVDCVAAENVYGFRLGDGSTTLHATVVRGTAVGNSNDGFSIRAGCSAYLDSCLAVTNGTGGTGYGINWTASNAYGIACGCAFYGNLSGTTTGVNANVSGAVTLTANPFVDPANGDFRLNTTAGGGADCRGAGRGAYTKTNTYSQTPASSPDMGALQHADITPAEVATAVWAYANRTLTG